MTISDTRLPTFGGPDPELVAAIRAVLVEHGALDRYGLTELHSHFPMGSREILTEEVNAASRTLTVSVIGIEDAEGPATSWRLNDPNGPVPLQVCPGHFAGH